MKMIKKYNNRFFWHGAEFLLIHPNNCNIWVDKASEKSDSSRNNQYAIKDWTVLVNLLRRKGRVNIKQLSLTVWLLPDIDLDNYKQPSSSRISLRLLNCHPFPLLNVLKFFSLWVQNKITLLNIFWHLKILTSAHPIACYSNIKFLIGHSQFSRKKFP